ncbi:hypothetical protein HPB49_020670 [Dermacentor silvarum]|uniref:Uncharacterized protein n=1 Tax=Dermacentor silvarum TaxID=543639 RepID=A0ACB8D7X9_DERSI|nr:hypothetical protein HPB49_020670 [Dermacentor silvarum]
MATSTRRTRAGNISPSDDEGASDEDVVVMFDSSGEEESDEVFTDSDSEAEESSDDTMATAREWYRIDPDSIPARPPWFELKGSPGVTITVSSPPQQLEIFEAYFDDELIDVIVVETNRYTSQLLNSSNLSRHSRFRKWSELTREELRVSLLLLLLQGIVHKPNERMVEKPAD